MQKLRVPIFNNDNIHATVKISQSFDSLDCLSINIPQSEVYNQMSSPYGVIAGRVLANRGVGVENVKISLFIPITNADRENPVISGLYPYETPFDVNQNGVRYNILPMDKQFDCHNPVGTMPSKRKVLDSDTWVEVFERYYKYTTTTNSSGDYMMVGVPTGEFVLHLDVDVSDIGVLSLRPYNMIANGASPNLFASNIQYKNGIDLDKLPQIQSQNKTVNVIPFWNSSTNEITITKGNFNLTGDFTPTAMFFGSIFSDNKKGLVNLGCRPRVASGENCKLETGAGTIEAVRRISPDTNDVELLQLGNDAQIDSDGNWTVLIKMNQNRLITDENGDLIPTDDPTIGIPTTADVRFRMSLDASRFGLKRRTAYYLVPNLYNRYDFFNNVNDDDFFQMEWNKVYTVSNFIPRYQKNTNQENKNFIGFNKIGECETVSPLPYNRLDENFNPIYTYLCFLLTWLGLIITVINFILNIVFTVVMNFVCLVRHVLDADNRRACLCYACYRLNNDTEPNNWSQLESDCNSEYQQYLIDETDVNSNCSGANCLSCQFYAIQLPCPNGDGTAQNLPPADAIDCIKSQLAENLNVVTYEFYNDFIIGSLYAPSFAYKIRSTRNRKITERFCDYECREIMGTAPDDPHYKNRCTDVFIVDRREFNNGSPYNYAIASPNGRGIVVENDNFLYYASRNDVQKNPTNSVVLLPSEKEKLLFATNIINVGSKFNCDVRGVPYLVDNLDTTSYQETDGVKTMYDTATCVAVTSVNTIGVPLISQIGVTEVVAAISSLNSNTFENSDGDVYTLVGSLNNLPDYGGQVNVVIFDREDLTLRRHLCENFNFFNTNGVYNTVSRPQLGDSYVFENASTDIVTYNTDTCVGLDNIGTAAENLIPYYVYFGINNGKTALDKLKNNYFLKC